MEQVAPDIESDDGWEWAVVEVFGHRKHAGRTREEERFGAKLLRVDIPLKGDATANGWQTIYYGGSSIFSFALCSQEAALKANKPYEAPARYALTHDDDGFWTKRSSPDRWARYALTHDDDDGMPF